MWQECCDHDGSIQIAAGLVQGTHIPAPSLRHPLQQLKEKRNQQNGATSALAATGAALKLQLQIKTASAAGASRLRRRLSKIFQRLISVSGFGTRPVPAASGTRAQNP